MPIFYEKPGQLRAGDVTLVSLYEGKGAAHGKKVTALIKYDLRGQILTEYVDLWNGSGPKKTLDLCDRIHKCKAGDQILLKWAPSKADETGKVSNGTAFDMARPGYALLIDDAKAMIISKPELIQKQNNGKASLGVKAAMNNTIGSNMFCFWGTPGSLGISGDRPIVCLGKSFVDRIDANGYPVAIGEGFKIYELNQEGGAEQDSDEVMISIGIFCSHPIPVSKVLKVSESELPGRVAWCKYVADEWHTSDPKLLEQKEAIRKLLTA